MVIYAKRSETDDPDFLAWVETVIRSVDEHFATRQTYVVKIDHWFGKRWLAFSGKTLGALGLHKQKLTLPPFVPSRVVSQRRFFCKDVSPGPHRRLHVWQGSGQNLQRYTDVVVHDASVFWYSGDTVKQGRASFMAYVLTPEGHWPWYVGLKRETAWRLVESQGISPVEFMQFSKSRAKKSIDSIV